MFSSFAGQSLFFATPSSHNVGLAAPISVRLTMQWEGPSGLAGPAIASTMTIVPLLSNITLSSTSVKGGTTITGNVQLVKAYTGSSTITVTTSNANAYFATLGSTSTTLTAHGLVNIPFTIHTLPVSKNTTVVVSLPSPLGYRTKSFNVTLTP